MLSSRFNSLSLAVLYTALALLTQGFRPVFAQDSTLFREDFDRSAPPALPIGWSSSPENVWTSSGSVAGPESGLLNVVVAGGDSGSVVSPVLDFSDLLSGQLSYNARRTSTFDRSDMIVEASTDGGMTFDVVVIDSMLALPSATSSYEPITAPLPAGLIGEPAVQIRIRALGTGGGNCRIDDFAIVGTGSVGKSSAGFAVAATATASGTDSVGVDVALDVASWVGELHGLQFDLGWSAELTVVDVERGQDVADEGTWDLAVRLDTVPGRVVLLSKTNSGLPAGSYPDLLTIRVTPNPNGSGVPRQDTLEMGTVLGSKSEDLGGDASLTAGQLIHVLTVAEPTTSFQASVDSLDFGLIDVDSVVTQSIVVSNPDGNVDLVVSGFQSDVAGITADPDTFSTAPGDSTIVELSADASIIGAGLFGGYVTFTHNAATSPDSIWVRGRVGTESTRGDVNDDGLTDLLDVVLAIDYVVGTSSLTPELADRVDLHPFPLGNGSVDVRDLTILVRAINSGVWPDGLPLPIPTVLAKQFGEETGTVYLANSGGLSQVRIETGSALRAVQVVVTLPNGLRPEDVSIVDNGSMVQSRVDRYEAGKDGYVGILAYTLEGFLSGQPDFSIAEIKAEFGADSLRFVYGMGVTGENRRVMLDFAGTKELPNADIPEFDPPYPQPFSASTHRLITFGTSMPGIAELDVRVVDVLGRTVFRKEAVPIGRGTPFTWNGHIDGSGKLVSAGVYFLTLSSADERDTIPFVVTN